MYTFKEIDRSSTIIDKNVVSDNLNLTTSSIGIKSVKIVSGSISQSYWNSLNVLFYTSGSPIYPDEHKFELAINNHSLISGDNSQHLNKFHGYPSCSIFTIPQTYYGERIKEGSFELVDNSNTSPVIIKDDKLGNLYATENTISHSTNHKSSSDNYVGNIFYDYGIAVVTETSSYSHTASTASIDVGLMHSDTGDNHFLISGSNLTDSFKFICTGSYASETDTVKIHYFASGSHTSQSAQHARDKVNEVFAGLHISASTSASVLNLTNDANQLTNRRPSTTSDNLPPISGSGGFSASLGFGGGTSAINYPDIGTDFRINLDSHHSILSHEYSITLRPEEFNHTMNYSVRMPLSGTYSNLAEFSSSVLSNPYLDDQFTGSNFQPYITTILFYNENDYDTPVLMATLPKPIRKSNKIATTFKVRLDL
tara:strand:- start:69 stop:1343 length:1275 start_codon:yes stop_codon:yes gene_type:complete